MTDNINQEEDLYSIVNNEVLKDKELSMQAKGLYAYLRSNSKDWKLYKTEVYNHFTNGRDAINKAWKELVDKGWIVSERIVKDGKMAGWNHTVKRSSPTTYWKPVNRKTRQSENPQLISNNSNNYQKNNNIVSIETKFEDFWKEIRELYSKYRFNTGSKQEALKAFKKQKLMEGWEEVITNTDKHLSNKRALLNLNNFVPNPKNVSGWISNRCWEDDLEIPVKNNCGANSGAYPPPGSAPPPRRRRAFGED